MSVNRYTIKLPKSGATDTHINLPVNIDFQIVDQGEVIERDFVNIEVEKSINPILDYEKVRLSPVDSVGDKIFEMTYELRFLSSGNMGATNFWSDVGMDNDDIKFRKNRWKKSFLRLNFYDTDKGTNQRLISFLTLFPTLTKNDIYGLEASTLVPPLLPSTPRPANEIPVNFLLQDPLTRPEGVAEGYFLYNFKDEITADLPKELYMRASFQNAKDGTVTNFMTENSQNTIDVLVNKLYTKYILKRDNTGYFYEIDTDYSNNVTIANGCMKIKLYQIQVL